MPSAVGGLAVIEGGRSDDAMALARVEAMAGLSYEHFTSPPGDDTPLVRQAADIRGARYEVVCACYTLTSGTITEALVASRAVFRLVLIDQEQARRWPHAANRLRTEGVRVVEVCGAGSFHLKALVVDGRVVWSGSMNPTKMAASNEEDTSRVTSGREACARSAHFCDVAADAYEVVGEEDDAAYLRVRAGIRHDLSVRYEAIDRWHERFVRHVRARGLRSMLLSRAAALAEEIYQLERRLLTDMTRRPTKGRVRHGAGQLALPLPLD